jgi:hypothetical protein
MWGRCWDMSDTRTSSLFDMPRRLRNSIVQVMVLLPRREFWELNTQRQQCRTARKWLRKRIKGCKECGFRRWSRREKESTRSPGPPCLFTIAGPPDEIYGSPGRCDSCGCISSCGLGRFRGDEAVGHRADSVFSDKVRHAQKG